uniref:Uncharacterized protein n=1 Tax=Callorhinchus milii TaxID=7868 RepID=A0A4W3I9B9_CALMI
MSQRFCKSREETKGQLIPFSVCPSDRIVLYPDNLYEEGGQLFRCICCHTIDHVRKYTIAEHIVNPASLEPSIIYGEERIHIDFVQYLTRADIPLEKPPAFQEFLCKYTKQGGTIPTPSQLWNTYLKELVPEHENTLINSFFSNNL